MFPTNNQYAAVTQMLTSDTLYTPEMKDTMIEFYNVTSRGSLKIFDLTPIIHKFSTSVILKSIMTQPEDSNAFECLVEYVRKIPNLPNEFCNRFKALCAAEFNISEVYKGFNSSSYTLRIMTNNVFPTDRLTTITEKELANRLQRDHASNTVLFKRQQNMTNMGRMLALDLSDKNLIQMIVNAQAALHDTIQEGTRQNGHKVDAYISTKVTHRNPLSV